MTEQFKVRGGGELIVHPDDAVLEDSLDTVYCAIYRTDHLRMAHGLPDQTAQAAVDHRCGPAGLGHKQIFLHNTHLFCNRFWMIIWIISIIPQSPSVYNKSLVKADVSLFFEENALTFPNFTPILCLVM